MLCLYPRPFRARYGDDLVQHFADLSAGLGFGRAWARTALDLLVTVPRYRLESVMSEARGATALAVILTVLFAGAMVGFLTDLYPALPLLLVAAALAVAQRSTLARAIRTPDTDLRRRRLRTAAVLGAVFAVSYALYVSLIGDSWTLRETVLALVGTTAMIGSFVFLIIGLLTPKTGGRHPVAPIG